MQDQHQELYFRYQKILDEIKTTLKDAQRPLKNFNMMAVSKQQSCENILALIEKGQVLFGENKVQEIQKKWPKIKMSYPQVRLHFIGRLQRNKVKHVIDLVDCIESLDRLSLAETLADLKNKGYDLPQLYLQVNTGEEDQKGGILPKNVASFLQRCHGEYGLSVTGIMGLPPAQEDPAPHFAFLSQMAQEYGLKHLSFGMSHDFKAAIFLGATQVRIGTGIFGPRK